jgi:hypothetical protein
VLYGRQSSKKNKESDLQDGGRSESPDYHIQCIEKHEGKVLSGKQTIQKGKAMPGIETPGTKSEKINSM